MFARLHPVVKICIGIFALAWVAAFIWAVGRYTSSTTDVSEMVARKQEIKGKAPAPADILPADNIPGVMPPKPPRPSLDEDTGYDIADFSERLGDFVGVEIGQDGAQAQHKIVTYFGVNKDEESPDLKVEQKFLTSGLTQVIVTKTALKDDSVKAEQFLAVFTPKTREKSELTAYGMRIKCYRGDNTDQWQTQLCP